MTRKILSFLSILLLGTSSLYATDYQVELIVFEHINSSGSPEGEVRLNNEEEAYPRLIDFNQVASEDLNLSEYAQKIRGSRNFRLLRHFAWSQEGLSREEAASVNLARWLPAGFQGTATLYLNRYLHLDVLLQKPQNGDAESAPAVLSEKRRMRSTEIHYLDHPSFSIIAQITPL